MTNSKSKTDVIMAGLGGMGVLLAGKLLAGAALEKFKYVSWLPSYGVEKRGGVCECTIIFSDNEISSPLLDQAQTVVIFDGSQFSTFEDRVKAGGIMLIDSAKMKDEPTRNDYTLIKIPAVETAHKKEDSKISNLILLGAYIGATESLPPEFVQASVSESLGKNESIKEKNKAALQLGIELGASGIK